MRDCKGLICKAGDRIRLGNHIGIVQPYDEFLGFYVKLENGMMRYLNERRFEIIKKAKNRR